MPRLTVVKLQSLKFQGTGSVGDEPIRLRDPLSNEWIGIQPQWENDVRNEPVAYVRGRRPSVEVGLQVGWFAPIEFNVTAWGVLPSSSGHSPARQALVGPFHVRLTEHDRRVRFISAGTVAFNVPVPDEIGRHVLELDWYATYPEGGQSRTLFLGHTPIVLCTTWQPMVDRPSQSLFPWAYRPLMEWSCSWCHGATAPRQICDLLLQNLPATGLQYGVPGWDVRSMLLNGGGMCGGWYQFFAQLANCQGVALSQETMMLPAGAKRPWAGLVITSPGLNQVQPGFGVAVEGHYRDSPKFPSLPAAEIAPRTTSRYFFGQNPDGHCINMLDGGDGTVTIYDPSFQLISAGVTMSVPPVTGKVEPFLNESPFRTKYFDTAVPFLMSQRNTLEPVDPDPLAFGVTVESPVIPEVTIVWNRNPAQEMTRAELVEALLHLVDTYVAEPDAANWRKMIQDLLNPAPPSPPVRPPTLVALEAAKAIPLKRAGRVPHSMPPAELIQFALLELLQMEAAAGEGGPLSEIHKAVEHVLDVVVSPRARALAEQML